MPIGSDTMMKPTSPPAEKICAVSGAAGYVGSRISRYLREKGWTVHALSRTAAPGARESIPFRLGQEIAAREFQDRGIQVLIHCAYDFSLVRWADISRINGEGSRLLLDRASEGGVCKIIHISTVSAFEGCLSLYGRAKMIVERAVREQGGVVIRPALVFGDSPGGMLGRIVNSVASARVLPVLHHPGGLRLVHEDDLNALIAEAAETGFTVPDRPLIAAAMKGWTLEDIVRHEARRLGKNIRIIPVPWELAWGAVKILEALGVRTSYKSDSILSLGRPNPAPDFGGIRLPNLAFRDFGS